MRLIDRPYTVESVELDELLRGDGMLRVRAVDSMGRSIEFPCLSADQPLIGDRVGVIIEKIESAS